ncbi:hypothetical protein DL96DRAFT_1212400 [Flagelloscypha sp. PMI_526]|nr:hypothetical protein DL96DRAFT_1212400 [Flagelloscypha sp. PMI_526]
MPHGVRWTTASGFRTSDIDSPHSWVCFSSQSLYNMESLSTNSNAILPIRPVTIFSSTRDPWFVNSNEYDVSRLRSANDTTAESVSTDVLGVGIRLKRPSAVITFVISASFANVWDFFTVYHAGCQSAFSVGALPHNPDPSKKVWVFSIETLLLVPITPLLSMPQLRSVADFSPISSRADGSEFLPCLVIVAV